jgi:hypothetical protein
MSPRSIPRVQRNLTGKLQIHITLKCINYWCERGDSNPHGLLRQILSLVRLPIPPLSRLAN